MVENRSPPSPGIPAPAELVTPDAAHLTSVAELAPKAIDPRILEIGEYWLRIRPARGLLPGRQHLDPVDIPKLLPIVFLADVERGVEPRFRWRLRGTTLEIISGRDYTGRYFDQTYGDFATSRARKQLIAVANGAACWWLGQPFSTRPRDVTHAERLMLPLAADGRNVDMILGLTVFALKS
ncbi:MAG TPA: PAS domain-containing protein [Alphaproteobacteria bacterium]|nr:PAS domain-containing protein [Alphaproteobacteria bacterium]